MAVAERPDSQYAGLTEDAAAAMIVGVLERDEAGARIVGVLVRVHKGFHHLWVKQPIR